MWNELGKFLFMSRLAIHLNSEDLNAKYTKWLTRHCVTVRVNELGIAIPHGSGNKSNHHAVVELLIVQKYILIYRQIVG